MNSVAKSDEDFPPDVSLDITGEVCPMTFVKTKLMLERMGRGQIALVRLKGHEPLTNVPRSLQEHGHEILSLEPESAAEPADGVYRLLFRKS
jgi:tRNA 2-thiouridine synthesizing protein A